MEQNEVENWCMVTQQQPRNYTNQGRQDNVGTIAFAKEIEDCEWDCCPAQE